MPLPIRTLGNTGLTIPVVGLSAGAAGDPALDDAQAGRLLHAAVDAGLVLIDTARNHAFGEERIGRHLFRRRHELVLSTKVGFGIPGQENWTAGCITAGIERALHTMRTDVIDIVHLHGCTLDVLARGECTDALARAVRAGKVRVAAYAGDGKALEYAIQGGSFGVVQCTLNVFDQAALRGTLAQAEAGGRGVLVKRPLASVPWRFPTRPESAEAAQYWDRHKAMKLSAMGLAWEELALRFAAHQPGVHAVLVGTRDPAHVKAAVKAMEYGPLPAAMVALIRGAYDRHGPAWPVLT